MFLLKISCNEWKNESRDKRELSACQSIGLKTAVLAKGFPSDRGRSETIEDFLVYRYTTKPLGNFVPTIVNKIFSLWLWASFAHKLSPDIISGHDLGALFIGWLANFFKGKKAKLVYDSHEFELGRNKIRNRLILFFIKQLERFLLKRSSFSIMVNESIANEVVKIYSLKKKPVVVKNIPNKWKINYDICKTIRNKLEQDVNKCLIVYHGAIIPNRGLEKLLENIVEIDNIKLLILGSAQNEDYLNSLKDIIKSLKIDDKILFHEAVPIKDLWKYVGAADISICPDIPNPPKSYYYMLPNKFFESIQSETPIISGNFPEIIKILNKFKIGKVYDCSDSDSLKKAINEIFDKKNNYTIIKINIKRAKDILCWEKEQKILIEAYKKLF